MDASPLGTEPSSFLPSIVQGATIHLDPPDLLPPPPPPIPPPTKARACAAVSPAGQASPLLLEGALPPQTAGPGACAGEARAWLPPWYCGPARDAVEGFTLGPKLGNTIIVTISFDRLPETRGTYSTLGLSVAPHEHGLLVRGVGGWIQEQTNLCVDTLIVEVDGATVPNWAGMLRALAYGRTSPVRLTIAARWPAHGSDYPDNKNAHI